jgi:tetratricopeptide (TPR) repeat protein
MLGALLLLASLQPALLGAQADPPASPVPVCTVSEAFAQFAEGRFAESAETLRRTMAADPGCAPAAYLLAESLMRLGRAKESLAAYTAAARLRIPVAADLRHVALDYALLPDYADARRWAQRARDLEPQDAENWYVLGRIDYSDGNLTAAVSSFQQAAVLDPGSVKVQNNLGLAYEGLDREQAAVEAYRNAIALGDQQSQPSEQPLINLAILLMHQANLDEPLPLLLRAVAIAPRDARAREQLGQLYLQRGELPQAQASLEQAVRLSPADSRLHFLLGQVYRREGMSAKAAAEFAQTASIVGTHSTPNYPPAATK